jgi:epoxyqueuosine reductase
VAPAPAAAEPAGALTAERFSNWLAEGYAGEMAYLARRNEDGELLRRSAREALPWARSILVCAANYNLAGTAELDAGQAAGGPCSLDPAPADRGWIARYAWSGDASGEPVDYHDDLLKRLRAVEAALQKRLGASSALPAPAIRTKCYVDTGPLLERDFAARAGIGWIGRNTCVLNQQLGSWLLLGVIVTSLDLPQALLPALAADRCGSCTRCIDACPTQALIPERAMDASRCIAYLTIEKKGSIDPELRGFMGRQVFGCDICQEVCPWNRRAPAGDVWRRREELVNPALQWLASLDQVGFKRMFGGSPLERTRRPRLQRNIAIAMGNSGDAAFLPQLERWREGDDAVLSETAAWAIERLRGSASIGAEEGTATDVDVCEESSGEGAVGRREPAGFE